MISQGLPDYDKLAKVQQKGELVVFNRATIKEPPIIGLVSTINHDHIVLIIKGEPLSHLKRLSYADVSSAKLFHPDPLARH